MWYGVCAGRDGMGAQKKKKMMMYEEFEAPSMKKKGDACAGAYEGHSDGRDAMKVSSPSSVRVSCFEEGTRVWEKVGAA